jgi:hypothetical protein
MIKLKQSQMLAGIASEIAQLFLREFPRNDALFYNDDVCSFH